MTGVCDELDCSAAWPRPAARAEFRECAYLTECTHVQATIYFCGLKGMMPGIQDMLERVAESKGMKWEEFLEKLKKNGQWRVEVY